MADSMMLNLNRWFVESIESVYRSKNGGNIFSLTGNQIFEASKAIELHVSSLEKNLSEFSYKNSIYETTDIVVFQFQNDIHFE